MSKETEDAQLRLFMAERDAMDRSELRDEFAKIAFSKMQLPSFNALMAASEAVHYCRSCYGWADLMLAARDAKPEGEK
jgi:hypothetical protein